jgi:uncharacterized protein (DUF305 family)
VTAIAAGAALLGGLVGAGWQRSAEPPGSGVALTPLEIGFAQDMSTHHLQAIELCHALDESRDQVIDALCTQMTSSQHQEIGVLSGWLMLLDEPQASAQPMAWMEPTASTEPMASVEHSHAAGPMPGMASWMEIDELRHLSGPAAETMFLQLMVRHHQGGLAMASYAAQHASTQAVAQLATEMIKDQSEEAGVMEQLLAARGAQALPYP